MHQKNRRRRPADGTVFMSLYAFVFAYRKLGVYLTHGFKGNCDDDEERGAADGELAETGHGLGYVRQDSHNAEEECAGQRGPAHYLCQKLAG